MHVTLRAGGRGETSTNRRASTSVQRIEGEVKEGKGYALRIWNKFNNDWTMNLVAMVSYNVLTSFFPLVLALITLLAFLPSVIGSPHDVAQQINAILPANVRSQINVEQLLKNVNGRSGLLSIVSVGGLLWGGSNVFGAIENAFAVIYRVKTRGFVPQKLMSVLMILIFTLLLPLSFASTFLTSAATSTLGNILPAFLSGGYAVVLGFGTTLVSLAILFLAIYMIVPNVPVHLRYAWRGALVAAIGMTIVNNVFPYYAAHFLSTNQYGAAALATAIVTITWFWFFSLLLLAGAQINALCMGIGYWKYDLTRVLMDQKIPTIGGAPTAIDALEASHHGDDFDSPVGLARDSVQAERRDEADGDANRRSSGARNKTPASSGGSKVRAVGKHGHDSGAPDPGSKHRDTGMAADRRHGLRSKLPILQGKRDEHHNGQDHPHAAREMRPDLVATGIATGGVNMATEEETVGPAPAFRGLVIAGVAIGLLRTVRGMRKRSHG
jgi:YihY family inner membrane protein